MGRNEEKAMEASAISVASPASRSTSTHNEKSAQAEHSNQCATVIGRSERKRRSPRIWTAERYRFVLYVRQLGEEQLRKCGETRPTALAVMEAGIRVNNRQTYAPIPESRIKMTAREFTNRLAEARKVVDSQ